MKNLKNNTIGITILVVGFIIGTLGLTYAIMVEYGRLGRENSQLVLGDIYMHYKENNQLLLEDAMPSTTYDESKYFEFTISGKNTYTKEDIWYEIVLNHGDNHDTRNTRIKDKLLKFTLVEIENNEIKELLLSNKSYSSLSNKRIWVETIKANTTDEINKKYRLYMRIDESTVIGNVEEDYTSEEWNDVFASIKVSVTGDFKEKELAYEDKYNVTDESCFTYEIADNEVIITDYDASCGTDIVIPEKINNYNVVEIDQNALGYYFIVTIPSTIKSLPCGGIVTNPTLGLICVEPEV